MKKLQKDVINFTTSNIILSAGGSALSSMGGSTTGINTFSSMMPAVAGVSAGSSMIRITKGMIKKKTKRRR